MISVCPIALQTEYLNITCQIENHRTKSVFNFPFVSLTLGLSFSLETTFLASINIIILNKIHKLTNMYNSVEFYFRPMT